MEHASTTTTTTTTTPKEEDAKLVPATPVPPSPPQQPQQQQDPPGMRRVSIEEAYHSLHSRLLTLERAFEQLLTEWERKGKTDTLVGTLHEVLAHHHLGILHHTHGKTSTNAHEGSK